jgi:hypothetical protein
MLKNLTIAALATVAVGLTVITVAPNAHYVIDPEPYSVKCMVNNTRSAMCGYAHWLLAQREGIEAVKFNRIMLNIRGVAKYEIEV